MAGMAAALLEAVAAVGLPVATAAMRLAETGAMASTVGMRTAQTAGVLGPEGVQWEAQGARVPTARVASQVLRPLGSLAPRLLESLVLRLLGSPVLQPLESLAR